VSAIPLRAPSAGSASVSSRETEVPPAEHSPSKPEPERRPRFRETHLELGHPSVVSITARSRPWDVPSPRARTPPDAIPMRLARAASSLSVSPWLEGASRLAHRVRSTSSRPLVWRVHDSFELDRAFPRCAWERPRASRPTAAFDRLLHSEPFISSTRASSPSQRSDPLRETFRRRSKVTLFSGAFRHRARPRERLFRAQLRSSEDLNRARIEKLGPLDATKLGRTALHGALPTSALGGFASEGVLSLHRESIPLASGTLVASSVSLARGCRATATPWLGGRQDRFRGGLVKGVRIPDPECLRSAAATRISLAPERE